MARNRGATGRTVIEAFILIRYNYDVTGRKVIGQQWRPWANVGPAKAMRTKARSYIDAALRADPDGERKNWNGDWLYMNAAGRITTPKGFGYDVTDEPFDRSEHVIYRLDEHGMTIIP